MTIKELEAIIGERPEQPADSINYGNQAQWHNYLCAMIAWQDESNNYLLAEVTRLKSELIN